jgi:signal transduction histidine kinase
MTLRLRHLPMGLKTKFVLTISFLILLTSVILSVFLIEKQSQLIQGELEKRGESMARNLAHNSEYGVLVESQQLLSNLIEGLFLEEEVVQVAIRNRKGALLADWGRTAEYRRIYREALDRPQEGATRRAVTRQYFVVHDMEFYSFSCPIKTTRVERSKEEVGILENKKDPTATEETIGTASVGLSLQNMRREIADMTRIVVLLTALVVAVGIALTIFLVNIFTKPVRKLVYATERVASGNLHQMVSVTTKDEIGTLASSFNRMIVSLQESREKIEEYNRTLERKVKERTAELENALKSLKETQVQLIQVEKMAAVGQLAAGVAHELNNPLGGILGYSQFALEKIRQKQASQLGSQDVADLLQYLQDIEQQTKRCRSIIQNLLKFSRSSLKEEFEPTDLNEVVRETLTFTRHQVERSKVKLVQNLKEDLPLISGHTSQLQQVFTNLILNAVQSMPQGGSLTITTAVAPDEDRVLVSFADTGEGIPRENLDKIFEPFFSTKKVGEGTGLGLSVSYGLIRNHGGEIRVASQLDRGTVFTVALPLGQKPTPAASRGEAELASSG